MKIPSFAHLRGAVAPVATKKAETETGDDRKKRDDETDDEHAARLAAIDEKDEKAQNAGKSAEADDDDKKDEDDMKDEGKKAIRLAERARCAAIFDDPAAANNLALAATLAFTTNATRSEAIRSLQAGGTSSVVTTTTTTTAAAPAAASTLDARMREAAAAAAANAVQASGGAAKPDMNTSAGRAQAILAAGNGATTIKRAKSA